LTLTVFDGLSVAELDACGPAHVQIDRPKHGIDPRPIGRRLGGSGRQRL